MTLKISLYAASAVLVLFALIPLIKKDEWYIRIFDYPRQQIAVISIALLFGYSLLDALHTVDYSFMFLLSAALLLELVRIAPYSPFWKRQVARYTGDNEENKISIITANVLMSNKNYNKLLEIIGDKKPDIVFTVETDKQWEKNLRPLEKEYPYMVKHPLDNTYGMHLYSKLKLVDPSICFLTSDEIPSVHTQVELRNGTIIHLYGLHPLPPAPQESKTTTERDAELLITGKAVKEKNAPAIVIGDLNDVAWSYTTSLFQKISGMLDPRRGRGFFNTFNAKYPLLRWPLDHVFHTNHFQYVSMELLPYFGSDHYPIYISLAHEPKAAKEQEKPEPDKEDKKLADEKILRAFI